MKNPAVVIADVTLREHGQTVPTEGLDRFDTELRVTTAEALVAAGLRRLELVSCISPRVAPAMAEPLLREVTRQVGPLQLLELDGEVVRVEEDHGAAVLLGQVGGPLDYRVGVG